jgi:hypothetical protein
LIPAIRAMCVLSTCAAMQSQGLTLTLLVARVGADHTHHTFATDDLAIAADLLDGCRDFHGLLLGSANASTFRTGTTHSLRPDNDASTT